MSLGLLFWILMILWFIGVISASAGVWSGFGIYGGSIVLFILFVLLGWQVFGPPIKKSP